MVKLGYEELSYAMISDKRNIVISKYSKGRYTLGQCVVVEDGQKKMNLFMKNSIHIDDIEGLYNLRDALNVAIEKIEKN